MDTDQKGTNPSLCLVSGIHGDEFGVISSVEKALKKYASKLPDYFWIPEVCPSAVTQKMRTNANDHDLNRQFHDDSTDAEATAVMNELKKHHFDLFVSFHEDLELDAFYCYDSESKPPQGWKTFSKNLTAIGVPLLNGIDDATDPTLGFQFKNGYLLHPLPNPVVNDGTLESWTLRNRVTKRYLISEFPGHASADLKDKMVDAFFRNILLHKKYSPSGVEGNRN